MIVADLPKPKLIDAKTASQGKKKNLKMAKSNTSLAVRRPVKAKKSKAKQHVIPQFDQVI